MRKNKKNMHRAYIIAMIQEKGKTLSQLSVEAGLHPRTLGNALDRNIQRARKSSLILLVKLQRKYGQLATSRRIYEHVDFSPTTSNLETMPSSPQGVNKKARTGNWEKRQVQGIRGVGYEYAFTSLPQETQAEILLKQNATPVMAEAPKAKKELNYLPEVIWKPYEKATDKQKEEAKRNSPHCTS